MTAATDISARTRTLVDFLNTLDVEEGTDALENDPEARDIRDALRAIVSGEDIPLPSVALGVRTTDGVIEIVGDTPATDAVAIAATLSSRGTLARVKLCPAHDCAWAFYDQSRNGSRTWCDMAVCGNREKARTFRSKEAD